MTAAIGYADLETQVDNTLNGLNAWLSDLLQEEDVSWRVAFEESNLVALREGPEDFIKVEVFGRLEEPIPEEYTNDSGKIRTPVFPVSNLHPGEEETDVEAFLERVFDT